MPSRPESWGRSARPSWMFACASHYTTIHCSRHCWPVLCEADFWAFPKTVVMVRFRSIAADIRAVSRNVRYVPIGDIHLTEESCLAHIGDVVEPCFYGLHR